MGTTKEEAVAVTPSLYIGDHLSTEHVVLRRQWGPAGKAASRRAVQTIRGGGVVLIPMSKFSGASAVRILQDLGVSEAGAYAKVHRALYGQATAPADGVLL